MFAVYFAAFKFFVFLLKINTATKNTFLLLLWNNIIYSVYIEIHFQLFSSCHKTHTQVQTKLHWRYSKSIFHICTTCCHTPAAIKHTHSDSHTQTHTSMSSCCLSEPSVIFLFQKNTCFSVTHTRTHTHILVVRVCKHFKFNIIT